MTVLEHVWDIVAPPQTQFVLNTSLVSFPFRCIGIRAIKVLTAKKACTYLPYAKLFEVCFKKLKLMTKDCFKNGPFLT